MIYYKEYKNHDSFLVGRFKNKKYDNNIYTFDIEVTSYIKLNKKQYFSSNAKNLKYHQLMK